MEAVRRNYAFSDAHLSRIVAQTALCIQRDLGDFNNFGGMSATTVTDLKALQADFDNIPSDEYFEGFKMIKTEEKEHIRKKLGIKISEAMALVALKYGKDSARYRHFGITGVSGLTDEQIQRACANIMRCAGLYLNDLVTVGFTQALIDELDTLRNDLILALDEQGFAIRDRDIATENRINMGNSLYNELMRFNAVGKAFWKSRNEAKYNDYVIYDEKGSAQDTSDDAMKTTDENAADENLNATNSADENTTA